MTMKKKKKNYIYVLKESYTCEEDQSELVPHDRRSMGIMRAKMADEMYAAYYRQP